MIGDNFLKKSNEKRYMYNMVTLLLFVLFTMQLASADQIFVSTNRNVVLDDPNSGTASSGFSNPSRNWGSSYWTGESTTIRAIALVTNDAGSPRSGVSVTFRLKNPANSVVITSSPATTNVDGMAYFSSDLNERKYWGYWTIEADVAGVTNNTRFVLNWWGCASCHSSKSLSTATHAPKSYYVRGYNFHNGNLNNDHDVEMSSGGCITCHRSYDVTQDWHTGKVTCSGCHANSNSEGLYPDIAGCYDTAGCHTNKNAEVSKVNTTTGYVVGGNYITKYSAIPTNSTKSHSGGSVECIVCHGAGHNIKKPYNVTGSSNANTENEQCWKCHTDRATVHMSNTNCVSCHTQDAHNVSVVSGADCKSCHNIGNFAPKHVNFSAAGEVDALHSGLNSGESSTVDSSNKKCWACHGDGKQPVGGHPSNYKTPKTCENCHTENYVGFTPNNTILKVPMHYWNDSGTNITKVTSCYGCHNKSEMMIVANDPDLGTINGGLNTGDKSTSHYGKKRRDLASIVDTVQYCEYCHNSTGGPFADTIANADNRNITSHSRYGTNPKCQDCHGVGRIHNVGGFDDIVKGWTALPSVFCTNCHGPEGTVAIKNKSVHNGTVECAMCHMETVGDVHPVKYLTKGNTFSIEKTNAVDCTTCHQKNTVDSRLAGMSSIPKIGDPLHHSDDINNGSKWGNYWTTPQDACIYCHNDTKHDAVPLGRPLLWNPGYTLNELIGSGTNCADCHYLGDSNYGTMSTMFTNAGKEIPPEITSNGWNAKPGYFNHTLSSYTDSQCKGCHDASSGGSTTVGQLIHSVSEGGGDNCIYCHTGDGDNNGVNISKFGRHANLNTSDGIGNVSNNDCWTCHRNKDMNKDNVYLCESCHTNSSGIVPVNDPALKVEDLSHGERSCKSCHAPIKYHMNNLGPKGFMDLFSSN